MDSAILSHKVTSKNCEELSTALNSNISIKRDAAHLNNAFISHHNTSKSRNDNLEFTKRSNRLGIKRKKFKFFNTTMSKVVPLDCLDNDSLEFAKEPVKLNGNCSPSLIVNEENEFVTNDCVSLPTIRILNEENNMHINSSMGNENEIDSDRLRLFTIPYNNEISYNPDAKRNKKGN